MSLSQENMSDWSHSPPDSINLHFFMFFHAKPMKNIAFSWFSLSELVQRSRHAYRRPGSVVRARKIMIFWRFLSLTSRASAHWPKQMAGELFTTFLAITIKSFISTRKIILENPWKYTWKHGFGYSFPYLPLAGRYLVDGWFWRFFMIFEDFYDFLVFEHREIAGKQS